MKKYLFIIALGLLAGVFFVWEEPYWYSGHQAEPSVQPEVSEEMPPAPVTIEPLDRTSEKVDNLETSDKTSTADTRLEVLLDVPFQPQAPFADWREPWENACEEASLVLANRFAHDTETLTREEMRDEILDLVVFQNERYGDYKDSDAARTAEMGRAVYGLKLEVKEIEGRAAESRQTALPAGRETGEAISAQADRRAQGEHEAGIEEIKQYLHEGKLVIAPMAGRLLGNPYFTPPGPLFHMIVIIGFDDMSGAFITHDVGTRRGEALRYPYERIWNALHDFPGEKERIIEGEKKIIVVEK